jgi:antitoxin (DNA-binding transcriptional repressor) of toxin-antitoxin stability system
MITATVSDFAANVFTFLRQAEAAGEEIVLTQQGEIKARLVPETVGGREDGAAFLARAEALRARLARTLPADDWSVQDYLAHGRR